jgi:[acyl-carrier-protein] S-malonyltransferase
MADRQAEQPGAMAAVIGLGVASTEALCRAVPAAVGSVTVANINTDEQVVVSGVRPAVEHLTQLARQAGARVVALPVGGAFHSPLMEPVRVAMAGVVEAVTLRAPAVPLVANVSGRLLSHSDAIGDALVAQISRPVRWADCVRTLLGSGCELLVELGSGVLSGLVRAIDPCAPAHAADSRTRLTELAAGVTPSGAQQVERDESRVHAGRSRAVSAYQPAYASALPGNRPRIRGTS